MPTRRATRAASVRSPFASASEIGLSRDELEILSHAALFHDIGKIAVPDAILMKPGELSESERAVMQIHPEEGAEIVGRLGFLADAVPAIRHHHENFDGSGYPAGLVGVEIPLGARIIHVADALDAMMNARVYRPGRSLASALEELRRQVRHAVLPPVCRGCGRRGRARFIGRGNPRRGELSVRPLPRAVPDAARH